MDKKWRETFLIHSRTERFQRKVNEAQMIIEDVLLEFCKPYVAFSGGKDSTCMLHLVLQFDSDIMVLHWDYGRFYIPREISKEIKENARKMGVKNLWVETSEQYKILKRKAINVLGKDFIQGLLPRLQKEGYDASFIGLREEESNKRRRRIRANRHLTEIPEFFPLKNWTWMDVWAYIVSNKLPYLTRYDLYAPIVGWDRIRFTTFFDPEFDKYGCQNVDGVLKWIYKGIT